MKRVYFKRLFITFLLVAMLPLCLSIAAISVGSYRMAKEQYQRRARDLAKVSAEGADKLLQECGSILESLAVAPDVRSYMEGDATEDAASIIRPMQTGREERMRIRLLRKMDGSIFPAGNGTALYDMRIYGKWGLLSRINRFPKEMQIYPNCTLPGQEKSVCLNLGRAVFRQDGSISGYVVLDLFRGTLLSAAGNPGGQPVLLTVADRSGQVILDTTGLFGEGKIIDGQQSAGDFLWQQAEGKSGLLMNAGVDVSDFYDSAKLFFTVAVSVLLLAILGSFFLARLFAGRLYQPIDMLVRSMEDVTAGKLDTKLPHQEGDSDEIHLVSATFNWMLQKINRLIIDAREESERKKDAEIKALQAQISPHFLYNMLNEIKALAKMGRNDEVAEFTVHLGRLLRRSITFQDDFVRLREELQFLDDYIRLQQIRYEQLFSVNMQMEEDVLCCRIPNLVLQPLVENAILHGFTAGREDYCLSIRGYRRKEQLYIEIYDNGVGVDENYLGYINDVEKGAAVYGGLGVENVQKRLLLVYGAPYGLRMESKKGQYTKVILTMPYQIDQEKGPR